jgi:hypothetical protein
MVHHLARRPAALAVGCVELRVCPFANNGAQRLGESGQHGDGLGALLRGQRLRTDEFSNGIAKVWFHAQYAITDKYK